ncbi:MAG: cytochrome c [Chloroflexota bacterium]
MPGTRSFFTLSLAVALLLIVMVPVISGAFVAHTIPDEVARGFGVWNTYGCMGCHTLEGQGSPYAPDLTHIYNARGEPYLREFLVNPNAFYPDAIRTMPRLGLTVTETNQVMAFLHWVGDQGGAFPPRPINISGGLPEGLVASTNVSSESEVPTDPVAAGHYWFSRLPANCSTCHSLQPEVVIVGPSLAGVATRAAARVPGQSAAEYLRTSILDPGTFVVPGFPDAMARNLGQVLNDEQINNIIAFLLTQKAA